MELLIVITLSVAGSAGWLAYFRWRDPRRHAAPWVLAGTLVGGSAAVGVALLGYEAFALLGENALWDDMVSGTWNEAIRTALVIGAAEESAKLVMVLPVLVWTRYTGRRFDGPLIAAVAGIGFAVAESIALYWIGETNVMATFARALTTPITHAVFAVPWGLGLAILLREGRGLPLVGGFWVSVAGHGAYDLFLARPGFHLLSALLVLVLWTWLIWTARPPDRRGAAQRQPPIRSASRPTAVAK